MLPDDPKLRKAEQNRQSHARRLARQAEEAAAHRTSPRLTANLTRATVIRLPSGKALPREEATWLK
jgi:hypothetical protein